MSEKLVDPCINCPHKGTRGEPCLTCPKRAAYVAVSKLIDPCTDCEGYQTGSCDVENDPCQQKLQYMNAVAELDDKINKAAVRTHDILVIKARRSFDVKPDDTSKVELNEGYEFVVNAAVPEIADGIAKMAIEMDKMKDLGEDAGMMFLTLCAEFYKKLKEGGNQ